MVSMMTKAKRMIVDNIFLGFQKSGTKSRGVLHFVLLRRFYDVLFVPLFCKTAGQKVQGFYILYRYGDFTMYFLSRSFAVRERNAGDCEKRRDCIT
jgi:hypothetical protein